MGTGTVVRSRANDKGVYEVSKIAIEISMNPDFVSIETYCWGKYGQRSQKFYKNGDKLNEVREIVIKGVSSPAPTQEVLENREP